MRPLKIYLAGPMRGHPEFNFPAFHRAAAKLRSEGFDVFNPAENDEKTIGADFSKDYPTGDEDVLAKNTGFTIRHALWADLRFLCQQADAIALLPGWEKSSGARAELATAEALGLRKIILEEIK